MPRQPTNNHFDLFSKPNDVGWKPYRMAFTTNGSVHVEEARRYATTA
ncbi:hypothetical protein [Mesorhizobium sp.]|nr:hypothetical protein [Mesorhizobium sp.]